MYDADLLPFMSIVGHPGPPIILAWTFVQFLLIRRESSGGMEWLGVWIWMFSEFEF